jgi:glycerophosphoryl diester phosphodiesterase
MKLIAHRGNLVAPNPTRENNLDYIEEAISGGFDVEIDLRHEDNHFYLGHDEPQYQVSMIWLVRNKSNLWIHCKDLKSLDIFSNSPIDFNYFWHQEDDYTLTSKGYIWTYPGKEVTEKSIMVMPEWGVDIEKLTECKKSSCYGICSDYVSKLR